MDRKTAIEWLEQIKHRIRGGDEGFDRQRKEALDMAIEALKTQEPEPVSITDSDGGGTHWYVCGACEAPINPGDKYCHECGKAVKWE